VQGPAGLALLRANLASGEAVVADAAFQAICGWGGAEIRDDLVKLADPALPPERFVPALRGLVRVLREAPAEAAGAKAALLLPLLEKSERAEERRLLLGALAGDACLPALRACVAALSAAETSGEAGASIVKIAAGVASEHADEAGGALAAVLAAGPSEATKKAAADVQKMIAEFAGSIARFEYAGPYFSTGAKAGAVFEMRFPPEPGTDTHEEVVWKALPRPAGSSNPWILNLDAIDAGEHRCVYLRAVIVCPAERVARIEIGADDGFKVWLNESYLGGEMKSRGLRPFESKFEVTLRGGENLLLLKVIEAAGQWAVTCAVRDAQGGAMPDVKFQLHGGSTP
jgi:hypothetical protein